MITEVWERHGLVDPQLQKAGCTKAFGGCEWYLSGLMFYSISLTCNPSFQCHNCVLH